MIDPLALTLVSACTALVASIAGPLATLRVSRRQFDATVLSSSRRKWIDALRNLLAELMSQLAGLSVLKSGWTGEWDHGLRLLKADPSLVAKVERVVLVRWKIRLMLNLNEADHRELDRLIAAAVQRLRDETSGDGDTDADIEDISRQAKGILKREWERVKRGT
jgi:hypothetical protein